MTLSDDELRQQLERRSQAAPLDHVQRVELIESIHGRTAAGGQAGREWNFWRWLPAAAVLVVVALVVVLAYPRTSPTGTPVPVGGTGQTVPVLTAQQLDDEVTYGGAIGLVFLARATVEPDLRLGGCLGRNPCFPRVLAGTNPPLPVDLGSYSEGPPGTGVSAFRVQASYVTYLGTAAVAPGDAPWKLGGFDISDPAIRPVDAWLVGRSPIRCPNAAAPNCGTDWLTPTAEKTIPPSDGLRVQDGAYPMFAADPTLDSDGVGEPRRAIYLIAPSSCQDLAASCAYPAAQMLGRIELPDTASPSATPELSVAPSPTSIAVDNGVPTSIDGEHVFAGPEIGTRIAQATDNTPFLVAGSISFISRDCYIPPDWPTTPLLPPCGGNRMMVSAGNGGIYGLNPVFDDPYLVGSGVAVYQVHVHDPRAADCPPAYRDRCESAVVVGQLAWSSPATGTEPSPTPAWWVWINGPTTCGAPADYRIDAGRPVLLGNCAGMLLMPPTSVVMHVGQHLDVHLFDGFSDLTGGIDGILRLLATDDDGATAHFLAASVGTASLGASGYCLDLSNQRETNGPCALLDVQVVP